MTKQIPLTQGKVALVSDHRFEYLSQWKWCAQHIDEKWYAVRSEGSRTNRKRILMHRQIAAAPEGVEVDHWDRSGLNNVDENLRVCTRSQNGANSAKRKDNTTGFKGVSPTHRRRRPYKASIRFLGHKIYLGSFEKAEDAARAYDAKAIELHGPYARTNF